MVPPQLGDDVYKPVLMNRPETSFISPDGICKKRRLEKTEYCAIVQNEIIPRGNMFAGFRTVVAEENNFVYQTTEREGRKL